MIENDVITGDCIQVLAGLPAGCADLVFADPPFNIGYQYDVYDDRRAKADYLGWTEKWLAAAVRVLAPHGSLFLAIGDEFVAEHKVRLDALGLTMRNWIVWHYTFGVNCQKKFNRSHAHILYYVRDPNRWTFNPDEVRVPSARQTTYADRRANPVGKLPDDTWVLRPQETDAHFQPESDTWHVPRVCGTFRERNRAGHGCQMPEAVLDRIIRATTNPGDLVLDPFAGSGTTLAVAKKLGRAYLGVELSEQYADGVRKRLQQIEFGADAAGADAPTAAPVRKRASLKG
jgi:site-specific DNA-methyltransferase (adenine-specific)